MTWDGKERRKHECDQTDKIIMLEENIKIISLTLARIEERLSNKMDNFDTHIKEGSHFRIGLVFTAIGLLGSVVGAIIAYAKMEQRVDFIWQHSYGVNDFVKGKD